MLCLGNQDPASYLDVMSRFVSLNKPDNDLNQDVCLEFQIYTSVSLGMLKFSFHVYVRILKKAVCLGELTDYLKS